MQLEKVTKAVVYTSIFALPFIALIVSTNLFFPYITGKNFAFRILIEVACSAWLLLAVLDARYRPRWTPLLTTMTVFVGVVLLADILGQNPAKSIWSNFERMDGWVTLAHLCAYIVVTQTVLTAENAWLWFWRTSLAVSAFISLHTLAQFLGSDSDGARLYSTLGNPIYLAVYALFHLFIIVILATRDGATRVEQLLYVSLIPFLLFSVYLTSTRGATLGIIMGVFAALAGIAWSRRHNKHVLLVSALTVALLTAGVVGFWAARESSFIQNDPLLKRFASITATDRSISARSMVWGMSIDGVKERPLLGWGQENFNYVFNSYYNPNMYSLEPWYDRTHNMVLDWLIAAGILGLLAYISIFCALLLTLYRSEQFTIIQKWWLFGLIIAYSFQNLTVFDQVISYVLFFSVIAWVETRAPHDSSTSKELRALPTWSALAIVPVAFLLVWGVNARGYTTASGILDGLSIVGTAQYQADQGNVREAENKLLEGLDILTTTSQRATYGSQEAREQLSQAAVQVLSASWVSEPTKEAWYTTAVEEIQKEEAHAPLDARLAYFEATVHGAAGQLDLEYETLLRVNELTPRKPLVLALLTQNALRRQAYSEARAYAEENSALAPEYTIGAELYATVLVAQKEWDTLRSFGENMPVIGVSRNVLRALIASGQEGVARELWEKAASASSTVDQLFSFALAYYAAGNKTSAQAVIVEVQNKYPAYSAMADDLLTQIKMQ